MRNYEVLAHTADIGISTRADSLEALIGNAVFANRHMYDLDERSPSITVRLEIAMAPPADLLVSVLAELLYRGEADELAFSTVAIDPAGNGVIVEATGIPVELLDLDGTPIKAVTYHDLVCEDSDDGWYARLFFDA